MCALARFIIRLRRRLVSEAQGSREVGTSLFHSHRGQSCLCAGPMRQSLTFVNVDGFDYPVSLLTDSHALAKRFLILTPRSLLLGMVCGQLRKVTAADRQIDNLQEEVHTASLRAEHAATMLAKYVKRAAAAADAAAGERNSASSPRNVPGVRSLGRSVTPRRRFQV